MRGRRLAASFPTDAQVRRISWVPWGSAGTEAVTWPPRTRFRPATWLLRSASRFSGRADRNQKGAHWAPFSQDHAIAGRGLSAAGRRSRRAHLILCSLNSTCLRATGSYFLMANLSVIVRVFFV